MTVLADALSRQRNNFDLVRLCAAVAVAYCHSFLIQLPDGHSDPVASFLGFDGAGSLGVYAFFLLSGMLVTASFDRQRSPVRFVALRVARIWPAVAGGSLFVIFVLGPLFTTLPLHDYFLSSETWANLDHFRTIVLKAGWVLPGVFDANRFAHDICAPLWTLPLEVRCYLIVLLTGMAGLLSSPRGTAVAVLLAVAVFVLRVHLPAHGLHGAIGLRDFAEKAGGYSFWPEPFFFAGMLLYGWRERIVVDGVAAAGLLFAFLALRDTPVAQPLFYLAFAYGVLWIGTTPLLHRFAPRRDYSYGVYLYGFTMQQCVAAVAPHLDHLSALFVAAPFVFACAWVSSRYVEQPVLVASRRIFARREAFGTAPSGASPATAPTSASPRLRSEAAADAGNTAARSAPRDRPTRNAAP